MHYQVTALERLSGRTDARAYIGSCRLGCLCRDYRKRGRQKVFIRDKIQTYKKQLKDKVYVNHKSTSFEIIQLVSRNRVGDHLTLRQAHLGRGIVR